MPKKYWKNMPEASLIPDLIAGAERRVQEMAAREASQPPAFHERLQAQWRGREEQSDPDLPPLERLRHEAAGCTRCPLHCHATQTVFGEGPDDAEIMFVGEQPGDTEDLAGRPFIGRRGRCSTRLLGPRGSTGRSFTSPTRSNISNTSGAASGAFTCAGCRRGGALSAGGSRRRLRSSAAHRRGARRDRLSVSNR